MDSRQRFDTAQHIFLLTHLAERSVDLAQGVEVLELNLEVGQFLDQIVGRRQELMQRRIEQADDDRVAVHGPEETFKVAALHGQQQIQRRLAACLAAGRDHLLHDGQTFFFEEHVLGAAEADAFGAVAAGTLCILRIVGIGPDTQLANLVGPTEQGLQLGLILKVRILGLKLADEDLAGAAVDAQPVAFVNFDASSSPTVTMKRRWSTSMSSSSAPQTAGVPN